MTVSLIKPRTVHIAGTLTVWHDTETYHDETPDQSDGWINPSWSMWVLHEERDDAGPSDVYDPDDWADDDPERDPAAWLAKVVQERLGFLDSADVEHFYAGDAYTDQGHEGSMSLSAIATGFTVDELNRATEIMQAKQYPMTIS